MRRVENKGTEIFRTRKILDHGQSSSFDYSSSNVGITWMNYSHRRGHTSTTVANNNSLVIESEMVQVKRKPDKLAIFAQQFTPARHLFNLVLIGVIGLIVCAFLILQEKEVSKNGVAEKMLPVEYVVPVSATTIQCESLFCQLCQAAIVNLSRILITHHSQLHFRSVRFYY